MPLDLQIKAPVIEDFDGDLFPSVNLRVLRLDQIHPTIHGNKWFKLKHNLHHYQEQGIDRVVSFGGAYSNHIRALAAAGSELGIETIGLIRGELPEPLNSVLQFAVDQGMELHPMSRSDYRRKTEGMILSRIRERFGCCAVLPEGGSNRLAVQGCEEIAKSVSWQSNGSRRFVALACGTGATMAGLIRGLARRNDEPVTVLGIAVLKAPGYLGSEVGNWLDQNGCEDGGQYDNVSWSVLDDFHCGGYARSNNDLGSFLQKFCADSSMPLEPVYSGKLFFALSRLLESDFFAEGDELLALHTGGIYPE